ncbi:Nramp family divalent metal transporter [Patescibacteria group bacterium]|nr:Nramp family divalent metal transporter [Patescibacteria group bacterium]MBU0777065.1 Nramp family divalent metal transporter [Patescibacteria group bacterium]MBU0845759.1 Nramp family divalent metal transporter [Patescibacteria group bacterium]MBU0923191.1 Nramp family divalent metal transporter [Patescibacteria group bacterium]MBU1066481.1 Nramp family divalent metal transporter [Patescibacteria group bacterium]
MSKLAKLAKKDLPKPLPLKKLLGPSFILLGLGLGSGELILWPYLASNYGLGIMWGALLGITFQFFINMEIERYALITGESIFVGLARKLKKISPLWFILSTLIPWMWPGIIASAATLLAHVFGINYSPILPIGLLVLIGVVLTLGPVIYKTQEVFQRTLIMIGVPFILALVFLFAKTPDWQNLAVGLIGKGNGFWFLPAGISLATFLGAFAYAGAGGNLNLAQSYYIKEKGYGMGKFSGRITSIFTGKKEKITLEGTTFDCTPENLKRFKLWWKRINIEHGLVFWATGAITMIILSLLAYTTVFGTSMLQGVGFVINEAQVIAGETFAALGTAFLLIASAMLFSTQFSVIDATSRIMSENLVILSPKRFKIEKLPTFFYLFLWLQIIAGVIIFSLGFTQPLMLVIIGATLNAIAMFVYTGLVLWLNLTNLDKRLRPTLIRIFFVSAAFIFYGVFSFFTILQTI